MVCYLFVVSTPYHYQYSFPHSSSCMMTVCYVQALCVGAHRLSDQRVIFQYCLWFYEYTWMCVHVRSVEYGQWPCATRHDGKPSKHTANIVLRLQSHGLLYTRSAITHTPSNEVAIGKHETFIFHTVQHQSLTLHSGCGAKVKGQHLVWVRLTNVQHWNGSALTLGLTV